MNLPVETFSEYLVLSFKDLRFRHVESRWLNSVPGGQEEMWRYRNSTTFSFKQRITNRKRGRTWNVESAHKPNINMRDSYSLRANLVRGRMQRVTHNILLRRNINNTIREKHA